MGIFGSYDRYLAGPEVYTVFCFGVWILFGYNYYFIFLIFFLHKTIQKYKMQIVIASILFITRLKQTWSEGSFARDFPFGPRLLTISHLLLMLGYIAYVFEVASFVYFSLFLCLYLCFIYV